jgi:hypothetical protein
VRPYVSVQVTFVAQLFATLAATVKLLFRSVTKLIVRFKVDDARKRFLAHMAGTQFHLARHLIYVRPKFLPIYKLMLTLPTTFWILAVMFVTMAQ